MKKPPPRHQDMRRDPLPLVAETYSPSVGREALRRDIQRARTGFFIARDPDEYARRILSAPDAIYETEGSYVAWCHANIGPAPAPWIEKGYVG